MRHEHYHYIKQQQFVVVGKYASSRDVANENVMVSVVDAFSQQEALDTVIQKTGFLGEIIGVSRTVKSGLTSFTDEPYWSWLDEVETPEPSMRVTDRVVKL